MALNALVNSFCHNQKSVGLKGLIKCVVLTTVGYTMDKIVLKALAHPIEIENNAVPDMSLSQTFLHDCSQNYTTG